MLSVQQRMEGVSMDPKVQRASGLFEPKASRSATTKHSSDEKENIQTDATTVESSSDVMQTHDFKRRKLTEEDIQILFERGSATDCEQLHQWLEREIALHGERILRLGRRPHIVLQAPLEVSLPLPIPAPDFEKSTGLELSIKGWDRIRSWLQNIVDEFKYGDILIRRIPKSPEEISELRVAVVGNVDAGKSSLLGVLTKGGLDDGRGKARVNLFKHKHEIETGRTSSIGLEILGFEPGGQAIVPEFHASSSSHRELGSRGEKIRWEAVISRAAKVISFIDLAGHEKSVLLRYLKTTIFGLSGSSPDFAILADGANAGVVGMSKEHLAVTLALSIPVIICITKIDMTPKNILEQTIKQLAKILRSPGCRRSPVFVQNQEVGCNLSKIWVGERLTPTFLISNVTGEGLDLLKSFLNMATTSFSGKDMAELSLEFSVTDTFSVPHVGVVASGYLHAGRVSVGDSIRIGPDEFGKFVTTVVKSIQRKRADVTYAEAGTSVTLALKKIKRQAVRKGMVIVPATAEPTATYRFEGSIMILYHNSTIGPNYQAVLHSGTIRQTARIISISNCKDSVLRTGDRATVLFEFTSRPEFLKEGDKLLFREGKTKGLGVVTKIIGLEPRDAQS